MTAKAMLADLRARLTALGTRDRAEHEQRYLKSDLEFLGVTQPQIRRVARDFARTQALDHAALVALVEAAWTSRVHELRSVAIGILELRPALLGRADADWLISLCDRANTWAHVDWLAVKVIGALVVAEPAVGKKLDRWARHDNFWVRRTALLAFHDPLLAGGGDFEHFARLAVPMLGEKEFFIRKAIGWVLREVSKKRPKLVFDFLREHREEVSGLTLSEGAKYLPPAQRRALRFPDTAAWALRAERRARSARRSS